MSNESPEAAGNSQEPTSLWSRSFILIFFANMAFNMGMNMNNSLLSLLADNLGATEATIGFVTSSFGISAILFRFIAAPVMDTYNRKNLVIMSALVMSVVFWGFSISTSIPMLVFFRLLQGCSMVFGNACSMAMVADMLPREKYNSGMGYYSIAQVVCMAIAPSVGLELADRTGFRVTYTIAACSILLAAILYCFIKINFKRTRKLKLSINGIIAKEALLPSVIQLFSLFVTAGIVAFLYLYARGRGITGNVGLYFAVQAATMLVTRPVTGRLTDKLGFVRISIPAICCNILAVLIISWSARLTGLLIAAFVSGLGQGALGPAIQALTMKSVPSERRGVASSTHFIAQDVGGMLGPLVAGQIVHMSNYLTMWRIIAIPYIISILTLILFRSPIARVEKEFASG